MFYFRPVTLQQVMHILEHKNGVDHRICKFTIPLSITLVRSGSGLYLTSSTIFIMQLNGVTVDAVNVCTIW